MTGSSQATHLHPSQRKDIASDVGRLRAGLEEMAVQDWMLLGYYVLLVVAALQGTRNSDWTRSISEMTLLLAIYVAMMVLVRGGFLKNRRLEGLLYRLVMVVNVEVSYFMFRRLLPLANGAVLDGQLYELDLALFGFEPAVAIQPWMTPTVTEWFSFFYYGYFYFLTAHVVPIAFFGRQRRLLGEFTFGCIFCFCVGHLTYMLVPGFGPGIAMKHLFDTELSGGPWLDIMLRTVQAGGAQKDIFPSIHTAVPTFICLFSFRHRALLPYRYTWFLTVLFTVNIVLATMFLRWHYLIDVVAGVLLGYAALWVAIPVTQRELYRRELKGLRPIWPERGYFAKT